MLVIVLVVVERIVEDGRSGVFEVNVAVTIAAPSLAAPAWSSGRRVLVVGASVVVGRLGPVKLGRGLARCGLGRCRFGPGRRTALGRWCWGEVEVVRSGSREVGRG